MLLRHVRLFVILALAVSGTVLGVGVTAPAFGQVSCGDTITMDTTVMPGDPITLAPCDCLVEPFGLKVVGDGITPVVLDLNFQTIHGTPACDVGVLIEGDLVVVKSGKITGFATGVATDTDTTSSTLHGMQVFGNGDGIDLTASKTTISSSVVSHNEGDCLFVRNGPEDEDRNIVKAVRCEHNGGRGFVIRGTLNSVTGNVSQVNGEDGFDIAANRTTVSSNRSQDNGGEGFKFDGSRHTVSLNNALRNDEDGFIVVATDSRFDRNRSDYNGDWVIEDTTIGGGTGMTANTYTNNRCTGNFTGKSSRPGLCK